MERNHVRVWLELIFKNFSREKVKVRTVTANSRKPHFTIDSCDSEPLL